MDLFLGLLMGLLGLVALMVYIMAWVFSAWGGCASLFAMILLHIVVLAIVL